MTRSTARRSPAPPSSPKAASMNFTAMPGNSSAMTSSTPTPSSAPPPDSPSPISSKTSSALPWAAPSAPGSFSFSAPTRAPARSTDSIPLPRQRQLLLPRHHRTVQAQSQAKPVRRYPGRPRPRQEAFLFRLLPGHPPDQRTRYHFHLQPHPPAPHQRSFRRRPRRSVLSRQPPPRQSLLDLRRRQAARLPQSKYAHHRTHQPRRARNPATQNEGRRLARPRSPDPADHRQQRGPRLLLLQPAIHLQREPIPHQRRLSRHTQEHPRRPRLPDHHRSV